MYSFAVPGMGLKHRIHPLAAGVALGQLDRLDEYLEGRAQIAAYLLEHLDGGQASGERFTMVRRASWLAGPGSCLA